MRALVLSGGANKGAYQAGVLYHLLHDRSLEYDILCGVSSGALNASFLSMYHRGQEVMAADALRRMWTELNPRDVYRRWPLGIIQGLWKPSLYNSRPLRELVSRIIDQASVLRTGRELRVGATCLDTGDYRVFDQAYEDLESAVMASCAFPGAFEPVLLEGRRWADGGVREITPLKAAIDAGAERVDVLVTSPGHSAPFRVARPRSYEVGFRAVEMMSDEVLENDLEMVCRINQLVRAGQAPGMRDVAVQVLRPAEPLTRDLFDFRAATCTELFEKGYVDAVRALQGNPAFDAA